MSVITFVTNVHISSVSAGGSKYTEVAKCMWVVWSGDDSELLWIVGGSETSSSLGIKIIVRYCGGTLHGG